ncbi:hypothetical protein BRW64_09960 [Mycolicibacterium diernhoferi]|nr:hypothetical protein BRW64_09960 [Mycolicibacterium diernhoferi]
MGAGGHRVAVHLQNRVDAVQVGDVHRDQGVQQILRGQVEPGTPPHPPHELPAGAVVRDADIEFVQRQ